MSAAEVGLVVLASLACTGGLFYIGYLWGARWCARAHEGDWTERLHGCAPPVPKYRFDSPATVWYSDADGSTWRCRTCGRTWVLHTRPDNIPNWEWTPKEPT